MIKTACLPHRPDRQVQPVAAHRGELGTAALSRFAAFYQLELTQLSFAVQAKSARR
jgi:hypothetical protein